MTARRPHRGAPRVTAPRGQHALAAGRSKDAVHAHETRRYDAYRRWGRIQGEVWETLFWVLARLFPFYIYDASTHERGIHTHRMRVAIASCRTPPSARHRYRIHDTSGHSHHARVRPRASSQPQGNAGDRPDAAETIDKLLSRAQEAVVDAERTVEHLEDLPSARLPTTFDKAMRLMRPLLKAVALVAYCWTMHAFGMTVRLAGGFLLAGAVGVRGYRNLSLSPSGALAALVVGWATVSSSFRAGLVLLGFFFVSSALTAFGEENKDVEEGHKKGGQRNWIQVGFISVARDRRWPSRGQLTPAHSLTRLLACSPARSSGLLERGRARHPRDGRGGLLGRQGPRPPAHVDRSALFSADGGILGIHRLLCGRHVGVCFTRSPPRPPDARPLTRPVIAP